MMHTPRLTHPSYIQHQNQWRPHSHGPRFRSNWPMQHNGNLNSKHNYIFKNNEDHWCETCDRGFKTMELLVNHKQQHQKCNIDGCQFVAHPKVITKHIQMQHSTGLYKKIAKLHNPEEIQKWREERKKRYPTKENVEKRRAEIKEKIDRGEKMGMRTMKKHRDHKSNGLEHGMKRKGNQEMNRKNFKRRCVASKSVIEVNNKAKVNDNKKPREPLQKDNQSIPHVDDSKTLKPFTGILNLLDDSDNDDAREEIEVNDLIEHDEYIALDESVDNKKPTVSEPVVCGALSSLICNYVSSDDESGEIKQLKCEKTENLNIKSSGKGLNSNVSDETTNLKHEQADHLKIKDNVTETIMNGKSNDNTNILNNSEKNDDDSGPEEAMIVKPTNVENNSDTVNNCKDDTSPALRKEIKEKNTSNTKRNFSKKFKHKLPSTLLEKLLHNEIRQERNIVLQCIRYIIKNNYFEKE